MKKIFLIVIYLFILIYNVLSNVHYNELFTKGNNYYAKGEFKEAVETYQAIIQANYMSSEVYFNLGNAYFKLNQIPLSILYYEKAKKLAPDDADILFNLELANQRIIDKITPIPELFFVKWWNSLVYFTDMDSWAMYGLELLAFAFLLLVVFLFVRNILIRKISFWVAIFLILCAFFAFSFAYQQKKHFTQNNEGIVFTPTVTVKSSPDANGKELFVIHEGLKVNIKETINGWHRIALPDGNEGWLQVSDIEWI